MFATGPLVDETGTEAPQPLSVIITGVEPLNLPFVITAFEEVGAGEFALSFTSVVGGLYRVERSVDCALWTADPGEIIASALVTPIEVESTPSAPQEFFRVVLIQ